MQEITTIGSTELIDLPSYDVLGVPAKTDTGADSSSIWASDIIHDGDELSFILFGEGSEFYTGKRVTVKKSGFTTVVVTNSFGDREERFKVKLPIIVAGRRVRATMTLADRANSTYPVLLGRRLLAHKFLVDVRRRAVDLKKTRKSTAK